MHTRIGFALYCAAPALALTLSACGSKETDKESAKSAPETSAGDPPADDRPIEAIAESIEWPSSSPSADSMKAARDAISTGIGLREGLEIAGRHLGRPQHVGSGVANWLVRDDKGACLNVMLSGNQGRVAGVTFDTFPPGSMGEAKCQNAGI